MSTDNAKVCPVCGRSFAWRRKWAEDWDRVRFCSQRCRREGVSALDERIERAILDLVRERGRGKSICPSEAARAVEPDAWKPLMPRVHNAARRLARAGRIQISAKGRRIEPDDLHGAVRLSMP